MRASLKFLLIDVCKDRNVTVEDMIGPSRVQVLVEARREFVKRARRDLKVSYPVIGRAINRDYTTAMWLYKTKPKPPKQKDIFTRREMDVHRLMRAGYGFSQIAVHLNIKESTVRRYARCVKAKIQ